MPKRTRFVVLGEDQLHQRFVYRFLLAAGKGREKIRLAPVPNGSGSGVQHVCNRLPVELQAVRQSGEVLIALVDADVLSTAERRRQLDHELAIAQTSTRVLIPKRNIETWIHHLLAGEANETDDYKGRQRNQFSLPQLRNAAAAALRAARSTEAPPEMPASLAEALPALRRIADA